MHFYRGRCTSTWSYENRVSKHVIFLDFPGPSNSLFTLLFAYVFFFWPCLYLGICVEVDVDRMTILPPPLPPPSQFSAFFRRYPQFCL